MALPDLMKGRISPLIYAVAAPAVLLSQHLMVALAYRSFGGRLETDAGFWLLPLRRLSRFEDLSAAGMALGFAFSLAAAWALAVLSFRRATASGVGHLFAALAVVPGVQIAAVAVLMVLPTRTESDCAEDLEEAQVTAGTRDVLKGVLAGAAIIVLAVLISAVSFGAYGWGLFVLTPFLTGLTTGYLANRNDELSFGRTVQLVLAAAALGSGALIALALEGLVCLVMAAPLGAAAAIVGGSLGRGSALVRNEKDKPLLSLALLPAVFALEGAMPPSVPVVMQQSIDIAAPRASVWRALTVDGPITAPPGMVGQAGLAYPTGARIVDARVGGERIGYFSTGVARERITAWVPERRLSFTVVSQPPAMEEMSPYRRVHAPHVSGYFDTEETSFELRPLPNGGTRLTVSGSHLLRIDPVLYWEPVARWAVARNLQRVLGDIRDRAEARR